MTRYTMAYARRHLAALAAQRAIVDQTSLTWDALYYTIEEVAEHAGAHVLAYWIAANDDTREIGRLRTAVQLGMVALLDRPRRAGYEVGA